MLDRPTFTAASRAFAACRAAGASVPPRAAELAATAEPGTTAAAVATVAAKASPAAAQPAQQAVASEPAGGRLCVDARR